MSNGRHYVSAKALSTAGRNSIVTMITDLKYYLTNSLRGA